MIELHTADGTLIEAEACDVGFREVRIENGLLLLNGKPLLIRGVNRHEHHPLHGQVMDEQTMVQDILLMKQNNLTPCAFALSEPSAVVHAVRPLRPVCGG